MALMFYCDTSGEHDDQRKLVVAAGYLANLGQWSRWRCEWDRVLREFNVDLFHATDLNSGRKGFAGWSDGKRAKFWRRITAITETNLSHGYAFGIRYDEEYRARLEPVLQSVDTLHGKFKVKMMAVVSLLAKVALHPRPASEKIGVVFERERGTGEMIEWLNNRKRRGEVWLQSAFADFEAMPKSGALELQSADLLAYESLHSGCELLSPSGRQPRSSLERLGRRNRITIGIAKPDGLKYVAQWLADFMSESSGAWHRKDVYPLRLPQDYVD